MRFFAYAGLSALFMAAAVPGARAATPPYSLAASVPLGGAAHWDYMHYHAATGQLFIAHGKTLTVVNTATNKVEGNVTGLDDTHGIAFDPATASATRTAPARKPCPSSTPPR